MRVEERAQGMQDTLLGAQRPQAETQQGRVGSLREICFELLWVKDPEEAYKRPRLRWWGSIFEGVFLICIVACLLLAIADSFCSLEPAEPESRCWVECCAPAGRCDTDMCHAHINQTSADHPVDPQCTIAREFLQGRDWALSVVTILFSVEYLLRLWACIEDPEGRQLGSVAGRVLWVRSPLALVDLVAILPFYVDLFMSAQAGGSSTSMILRTVRLLRILSVFRLERPLKAVSMIYAVCSRKSEELMVTLFGAAILILLLGSVVYIVEFQTNKAMFPDIPSAMWWCVNCLSTVGYGDVYPTTVAGKAVGVLAAVLGVGLFAMPAGIMGSGFLEVYSEHKETAKHRHHKTKKPDGDGADASQRVSALRGGGAHTSAGDSAATGTSAGDNDFRVAGAVPGDVTLAVTPGALKWTASSMSSFTQGESDERWTLLEDRVGGIESSVAELRSLLVAQTSLLEALHRAR